MAKKINSKLALKKETLRSLTDDQLRAAAGGNLGNVAYGVVVPPSKTLSGGCTPTDGCLDAYKIDPAIKYYP